MKHEPKTPITIATDAGPRSVIADVWYWPGNSLSRNAAPIAAFAVHDERGTLSVVTHVPSGMSVWHGVSRADAVYMARELTDVLRPEDIECCDGEWQATERLRAAVKWIGDELRRRALERTKKRGTHD